MLQETGLECTMVNKVSEGSPHIVDLIKNDEISLIVNYTEDTQGLEDATAMLGKEEGNEVTVKAPKGDILYEILEVQYK